MTKIIKRCFWCEGDSLYEKYHDKEWGTPCRDDRKLFEMLILESFQAGLSWRTILYKRPHFKKAFQNFNVHKISQFTESDIKRLLNNKGIIRNRLKIEAAINNAQKFLQTQKEFGTFAKYIWQFAPKKSKKIYSRLSLLATTKESDRMAEDIKNRDFKFLGSTTCYAFMQSVGMVNDHITGLFLSNLHSGRPYDFFLSTRIILWRFVKLNIRKEKVSKGCFKF